MGVLRFNWQGVLTFDRIGARIPQLVQIWLDEIAGRVIESITENQQTDYGFDRAISVSRPPPAGS